MGNRALIYCRISLDRTGERLGVERQEEACRELAQRRGWEVVGLEVDNSISASDPRRQRPGWEACKRAIAEGRCDYIIAWHFDRITRSMLDLEDLIVLAEQSGVGMAFVHGDLDLTTQQGRLNARVLAAVARAEMEAKSERQKAMHVQRAKQGRPWWSNRPFGYNRDGTPHPEEAPLVRELYDLVLAGVPYTAICREWNERGIKTTFGNEWSRGHMRKFLQNPRNAGIQVHNGEEIGKGGWEPLVDEGVFRAVCRIFETREGQRQKSRTGLLTHVLRCARCGSRKSEMLPSPYGYRYYRCRGTGHYSWPEEWLDAHVKERALIVLSRPDMAEAWSKSEPDLKGLQNEAQRLRTLLDELLQDRMEGLITRAQWRDATESARAKLEEVEEQLSVSASGSFLKMTGVTLDEARERWESLTWDQHRAVIGLLFPRITLPPIGRGKRVTDPDVPDLIEWEVA